MTTPSNWWMFHGDAAHSGQMTGSAITSQTAPNLKIASTIALQGPVLSVPAVVDGYIYVGTANSHQATNANGGSFFKINIQTGQIENTYTWSIEADERDSHSFTGMGCTPAVADGNVYFSAFNGKLYSLSAADLSCNWVLDMRNAQLERNQPITNTAGVKEGYPPAAGWSSPVVANGNVYVGIGEGENPELYSFVFCVNATSGQVNWIYCTCQYQSGQDNAPNVLPSEVILGELPAGFSLYTGQPVNKGCSVWSSIAYSAELNRLYCATGNPQPDINPPTTVLPAPGYSYGILALDATSGAFMGFTQIPADSVYRPSDIDIDFGGSPTLFSLNGRSLLAVGCKNGAIIIMDATTLEIVNWRQMLPHYNDGTQIATVDPHGGDDPTNPNPHPSNDESNTTNGENLFGTYSTAAFDPLTNRLFIGLGGNNYHLLATGIDSNTTPFMRAMNADGLADAWPLDNSNPPRYANSTPPMYSYPGESALSSPAVVNDVVFCATSKVSLYALSISDGRLLWHDDLGMQTGGYSGGYGYCMGPAIWGDYVVAGGLINGRDGGILRIYTLSGS